MFPKEQVGLAAVALSVQQSPLGVSRSVHLFELQMARLASRHIIRTIHFLYKKNAAQGALQQKIVLHIKDRMNEKECQK